MDTEVTLQIVASSIENLQKNINTRFDDLKSEIGNTESRNEDNHKSYDTRIRKSESVQSAHSLALKIIGSVSLLTLGAIITMLARGLRVVV